MTTTITGRNQITIPAALVERMGLTPGTRIAWEPGEVADEFICRVVPDPAVLAVKLRGAGRQSLKSGTTGDSRSGRGGHSSPRSLTSSSSQPR